MEVKICKFMEIKATIEDFMCFGPPHFDGLDKITKSYEWKVTTISECLKFMSAT